MTYTAQQLQAMSDHTVNHALYAKLYYSSNVDLPEFCPDYCNNPNDIMPLAFERRIAIIPLDKSWTATTDAWSYMNDTAQDFKLKNALSYCEQPGNIYRAIACLLLMMED